MSGVSLEKLKSRETQVWGKTFFRETQVQEKIQGKSWEGPRKVQEKSGKTSAAGSELEIRCTGR